MMPGMPMMPPSMPMPGVVPPPPRIPKQPPPTQPCQTLYIRNLPETRAIQSLETALKALFSQYGEVLHIRLRRNISMRGQAFVTFTNEESATKALKEIQGFPLSGRPMVYSTKKELHYRIVNLRAHTFHLHKAAEVEGEEALAEHKRRRIEKKGYYYGGAMPEDQIPPNNILFVQHLPTDTTEAVLAALFKQFQGFKEVRLVPGKSDIAFVEYDTEIQAGTAKQALNKFKITPEKEIKITYAKK
ncbi:hypothetical protein DFS34DRAFT_643561 [Phlyctochytrium arcticum]|nr:hypothetical protein DFS34DRAFT_643561 [Phlyctochytrium arcticum]